MTAATVAIFLLAVHFTSLFLYFASLQLIYYSIGNRHMESMTS